MKVEEAKKWLKDFAALTLSTFSLYNQLIWQMVTLVDKIVKTDITDRF